MQKKSGAKALVTAALIAAGYAATTYISAFMGLAYGPIQFRLSEALTILSAFTPAAIGGLTIGCFLGNLTSPFGLIDIICGTAATLVASAASYFLCRKKTKITPFIAPIPTVLANAIIVGAEITLFLPQGADIWGFLISATQVALGELAVCYALGVPLYFAIQKTKIVKYL